MRLAYPDPEYRLQVSRQWQQDVAQALSKGEATPPREYRITCKDGTQREVEIITRPVGDLLITSFLDVTERKNIEAELRRSLQRNRAILAAQPDLLFVIDSNLVFRDCIASDPTRLLQPPEKVIGAHAREILPPYLFELTQARLHATLQTGQMQMYDYSLEFRGQTMFYESRMTRRWVTILVLVLVRDVTEARRTEQALRESEAALPRSLRECGRGRGPGGYQHAALPAASTRNHCDILGYRPRGSWKTWILPPSPTPKTCQRTWICWNG